MSELPDGWTITPLENVVDILDSHRVPLNSEERERRIRGKSLDELYPYYGATGTVGLIDDFLFDEPTLLLGEDGVPFFDPLRTKAYQASGKHWVNNHAHVLRARKELADQRYLCGYLNQFDYTGLVSGSTRLKLTQAAMRAIPCPLAHINEQKRIADKLDALLARVDACRQRLDRLPPLLKRFRQAVLAAATSGDLTAEWREAKTDIGAPVRATLGKHVTDMNYGTSAKSSPIGLTPVLRMGNIQDGRLDWNNLVFTSDPVEIKKYTLTAGDVLFNRTNSPELVGKSAIYNGEQKAIFAGYLIRFRCSKELLPNYINYCLCSPEGRDYCWRVKSDGVSQSNINAQKLAAFNFLLPSLTEQTEIVRRVEILFAYANKLEARLKAARNAVERATPALLAKAFRGELVPQDSHDEPAALLERLRAARSPETPRPRPARRSAAPTLW